MNQSHCVNVFIQSKLALKDVKDVHSVSGSDLEFSSTSNNLYLISSDFTRIEYSLKSVWWFIYLINSAMYRWNTCSNFGKFPFLIRMDFAISRPEMTLFRILLSLIAQVDTAEFDTEKSIGISFVKGSSVAGFVWAWLKVPFPFVPNSFTASWF